MEEQKRSRMRTAPPESLLTARAEWVAVLELANELKRNAEVHDPSRKREQYPIASR